MPLRTLSFAVVVGWFAMLVTARAETVSFPKENPAFTVDLPEGTEPKFENGSLSVRLFKYGKIVLRANPDGVHDNKTARAELAHVLDRYMSQFYAGLDKPTAPEVPTEPQPMDSKAQGFSVESAAGKYVKIEGSQLQAKQYLAAILTFDGKRYFEIWAEYDLEYDALLKKSHMDDFIRERYRIINSIQPLK